MFVRVRVHKQFAVLVVVDTVTSYVCVLKSVCHRAAQISTRNEILQLSVGRRRKQSFRRSAQIQYMIPEELMRVSSISQSAAFEYSDQIFGTGNLENMCVPRRPAENKFHFVYCFRCASQSNDHKIGPLSARARLVSHSDFRVFVRIRLGLNYNFYRATSAHLGGYICDVGAIRCSFGFHRNGARRNCFAHVQMLPTFRLSNIFTTLTNSL